MTALSATEITKKKVFFLIIGHTLAQIIRKEEILSLFGQDTVGK